MSLLKLLYLSSNSLIKVLLKDLRILVFSTECFKNINFFFFFLLNFHLMLKLLYTLYQAFQGQIRQYFVKTENKNGKKTVYFILLLFFPFSFICWRLITLPYCSGFCHTLT